jgi:hypothetical protein
MDIDRINYYINHYHSTLAYNNLKTVRYVEHMDEFLLGNCVVAYCHGMDAGLVRGIDLVLYKEVN